MKQYLYVFNKKSNQINVSQNNNIIRKINVNKTDNINSDNLEKTPKKAPFIDKFTSKPLSNDDKNYFNFKSSGWHLTIIYLITFVATPIIYSLVKMYAFNTKIDELHKSKEFFYLFFLVPIFGFVISLGVDWHTMIKKGGWAAYTHLLFAVIASIFVSIFLLPTNIISNDENDSISLATTFLVQQLFQLLGSGLVLLFCKPLRQKIITTLKEAKVDIITWVIIFAAIAEALNFLIMQVGTVKNLPFFTDSNKSSNQSSLDSMKATTYGVIVLFISTTIFAPINEEISYRFGSFTIVRHRWLGFMASFIYFPSMHVMGNGDWANITGYLSLGFFLPLLFVMTRGNVVYTISLHAFCNLLANIYGFIHH